MSQPLVFFFFSLTQLKILVASPSVSSMSFAIKGADLLCLTESLFSTSSDNSVGAVEAEPQAEGM